MSGSLGPMWFEPAPSGYPWSVLAVPVDITKQVSQFVDYCRAFIVEPCHTYSVLTGHTLHVSAYLHTQVLAAKVRRNSDVSVTTYNLHMFPASMTVNDHYIVMNTS